MTYSTITHSRTLAALVIACVMAAFFAQPAAAQTANKLNCNGCVKSKQLKNGGIKGKDIKDNTVTGSKIAPDAVDGSKISDGAVGKSDLANNSVDGSKISDGAVGKSDLANNSVDGSKISDGAVGKSDLANNSVDGGKVQDSTLTGADVEDNSLTADDLFDEAGAAFLEGPQSQALNGTGQSLGTVTLNAPRAGLVVVLASGLATIDSVVSCSITTGAVVEFFHEITFNTTQSIMPWAGQRVFVVGAGSADYNLICASNNGGEFFDLKMTAMYFPTQY